jgi:hypothetical protein
MRHEIRDKETDTERTIRGVKYEYWIINSNRQIHIHIHTHTHTHTHTQHNTAINNHKTPSVKKEDLAETQSCGT